MHDQTDIQDGIHFGLDEDIYHSLPMVSGHNVKSLLISPLDYWENSHMNPTPDEESEDDSFAKILGRAYHTRILEGKETFARRFASKFACPKDALDTNDELKEELRRRDLPVGGNKQQLIERLLTDQPNLKIRALLEDQYTKIHAGKDFLDQKYIARIERAAAMIELNPETNKAFAGGFPEVTIIWSQDGIRRRARLDYLKPAAIVDLKSFANKHGKPVKDAIITAAAYGKFNIQVVYYTEAARAAVGFAKSGHVFAHGGSAVPTKEWLSLLASRQDDHEFFFVFQQTGKAPVARLLRYRCPNMRGSARTQIEHALYVYQHCIQTYGTDGTPWVDNTPLEDFYDEDFPPWAA